MYEYSKLIFNVVLRMTIKLKHGACGIKIDFVMPCLTAVIEYIDQG